MTPSIDFLKEVDILSSLKEGELFFFWSMLRTKKLKGGETLFKEGDDGDTLYIVAKGKVSIIVSTENDNRVKIAEMGCGDYLGEMSIFDKSVRSATAYIEDECYLLCLSGENFEKLIKEHPEIAIRVMKKMVSISCSRLDKTGSFLSEMVSWGEQARKRAITDSFTNLYNKHYIDETLSSEFTNSELNGTCLSVAIVDLDHFGSINKEYGEDIGDCLILAIIPYFKTFFGDFGILGRYGGDEFMFVFPGINSNVVKKQCDMLLKSLPEIRILESLEGSIKNVTCSIGIASYPENGLSATQLKELCDKALYESKENGRNKATVYAENDKVIQNSVKAHAPSIAHKNHIINNIITLIDKKNSFLMIGHSHIDEDCLSSMVAFSLLVRQFGKKAEIVIVEKISSQFGFLLDICAYNSINILSESPEKRPDVIVMLDTPKRALLAPFDGDNELFNDSNIVKVEIDHHLFADSIYMGDEEYSLVDEAASCCELVGMLSLKLNKKRELLKKYKIGDLFSRNFVLTVLTGMAGDSKMGKFLNSRKERWYYNIFSNMFESILAEKTRKNSENYSSMKQVFSELESLSEEEQGCFNYLKERELVLSERVGSIILKENESRELIEKFDYELLINMARYSADYLAEKSKHICLVAFNDFRNDKNIIQFRMRRASGYKGIDLREVLKKVGVRDGGGHPGAVAFRVPSEELINIMFFVDKLILAADVLMNANQ